MHKHEWLKFKLNWSIQQIKRPKGMFFIVDHGKGGESNYGTKAFNLGFQQIICSHIRFNI